MSLISVDLEHHRFGPWLLEIKKKDDIPKQYHKYESEILKSTYAFKVPINEDRTNTVPGMLLYQMIVCIFEDEVLLYQSDGTKIMSSSISTSEILYISSASNLLSNHLIIYSDEQVVNIAYNAVSEMVARRAVELLRDYTCDPNSAQLTVGQSQPSLEPSLFVENLLNQEQVYTPSTLIAYEGASKVTTTKMTRWDTITQTYNPYQIQECAAILSSKELILFNPDKGIRKKRDVDYGYSINYIPLKNLGKISRDPLSDYNDTLTLHVHCGNKVIDLNVSANFDYKGFGDRIKLAK